MSQVLRNEGKQLKKKMKAYIRVRWKISATIRAGLVVQLRLSYGKLSLP